MAVERQPSFLWGRWLGSLPSPQHHRTMALWPRGGLTSGTSCTVRWHVPGVPGGLGWGGRGHQFFRSLLHSPWHPHSSLSLSSSASPGWSHHQQARPVLQPVLTKAGNGCGASACHCGEERLEFGLMFSIRNNRALVKPQRRRCYRCSKLIVRRVAQMWDPKA